MFRLETASSPDTLRHDEHRDGLSTVGERDRPRPAFDPAELAAAAKQAARATFESGTDIPGSAFYEAADLSPEQTWDEIVGRVAAAAYQGVTAALEGKELRPRDLGLWHESIFGALFPDQAGRFVGGKDRSEYEITLGTREAPVSQVQAGTQGRYVSARLTQICDELAGEVAIAQEQEGRHLHDATSAAARFYCKLLSSHPFEDGNGRVGYVALQHALVSLGATAVALPDPDEHAIALGRGMRRDSRQSYEPLAELLEAKIRVSAEGGVE